MAGIVGRADVLACLLFLLAFLSYDRYVWGDSPFLPGASAKCVRRDMHVVCVACYICALCMTRAQYINGLGMFCVYAVSRAYIAYA